MRIWSIDPSYFDRQGLIALWREALLAQKVLQGATKGYTKHPQLLRFKECVDPVGAIADYLRAVFENARERGYSFDSSKIARVHFSGTISVTNDQIRYEFSHLLKKLKARDPVKYREIADTRRVKPHPMFTIVKGGVEGWERVVD